jgi:hypothetical protein
LSISFVRKLEQDAYGQVRLATAHKLAKALGVTTSALVTEPDAPVPAPESAQQWEPVRLALEGIHATIIRHRRTLTAEIRELADVARVPL